MLPCRACQACRESLLPSNRDTRCFSIYVYVRGVCGVAGENPQVVVMAGVTRVTAAGCIGFLLGACIPLFHDEFCLTAGRCLLTGECAMGGSIRRKCGKIRA